jgi:hypothetical protein
MARIATAGCQAWIDRCHLPLVVGFADSISPSTAGMVTRITLTDGKQIPVVRDLGAAVLRQVECDELLCLRLRDGVAVAVDFADGRAPLVSAGLAGAGWQASAV